jgi:protein-S-isoprenylcysteine O-methyltransferase Ste14
MKTTMIAIGDFFFRYRNQAFPLIVLALFVLAAPPSEIFQSEALEHVKDMLALAITLSGLALRATVIGYAYIKRGGLNKKVYAKNLVTEGMFGVCRNPLYVGNMLIYAGIFVMHGHPLVLVLGIALYAFMYQCIVLAEERFLEGKFGEGYAAYCADVPRWIPRFSRFADATDGMEFNFKRVLAKDYSTIAAALITLALVEAYESLALPSPLQEIDYITLLVAIIGTIGILAGIVSFCKKRGIFDEKKSI